MMNAEELDETYSMLSEAIGRVGPGRAPLFLATLSLALLARQPNSEDALYLVAQAERLALT